MTNTRTNSRTNTMAKLAMIGALALSSMGLTACTDEQISLGAGVVIGAIIADDGGGRDHHRDRGGRVDRGDHGGRGHHGRDYPPPRPGGRHGRGGYYGATLELALVDSSVMQAAQHFGIAAEPAGRIFEALTAAQAKDFSKLTEIGLKRQDLEAMARGENPTASALLGMSQSLGLELGETHDVIQTIKADLEANL